MISLRNKKKKTHTAALLIKIFKNSLFLSEHHFKNCITDFNSQQLNQKQHFKRFNKGKD